MGDGFQGIDPGAARGAAGTLRRAVEEVDWAIRDLAAAAAVAGDLTGAAQVVADEMRQEVSATADLLDAKADEMEHIPYDIPYVDALVGRYAEGIAERLARHLDNGVGADAGAWRERLYTEGERWDFDADDVDVLVAGAYFPVMLDRLRDLPETFEFFGLTHKAVQIEIASTMNGYVTMECYVKGSGFADLCTNHADGMPYAVAEVKPSTPWSIQAGIAQLNSRIRADPGAVLAWTPQDPFSGMWPDSSADTNSIASHYTDLVGVDLTWAKYPLQPGLYAYTLSGLPTAYAWREAREEVRQTTANHAFQVLPEMSYQPAGASGSTNWTLDTPKAVFLGTSVAAAAAALLFISGGVATQSR